MITLSPTITNSSAPPTLLHQRPVIIVRYDSIRLKPVLGVDR